MAKYGSSSLIITFDSVAMTAHVQSINGFEVEALTQDSQALNELWGAVLPTGNKRAADVVLRGFYDDTATTGVKAKFGTLPAGPSEAAKTLVLTWGGSNTSSLSVFVAKFVRLGTKNGITEYEVTLRPTGAVTEA